MAVEHVADGTAHHDRCAQARQRQADHCDPAVLSVRAPGQEASRPRADLGAAGRRPAQDRRRKPDPRAQNLLTGYIAENYANHDMVVVSPDSGRVRVAEKWADSLGGVPLAFIHKTRDPLVPNQVVSNRVVGDVRGKTCILTDDMIDTGGTIAGAVKLLHQDGAKDVIIAATHGVLSDPAPQRRAECGAREVIVTNTLPIGEDKQFPQLTVLSIAPLLASTIRAVFENGSVTGLFDGSA